MGYALLPQALLHTIELALPRPKAEAMLLELGRAVCESGIRDASANRSWCRDPVLACGDNGSVPNASTRPRSRAARNRLKSGSFQRSSEIALQRCSSSSSPDGCTVVRSEIF